MSVSNQVTKNKYTLNGSTTTFSYTFDIATSDGSDIHLFLYNTTTSSQTEITSGFTVDTTAKTITWSGAASYGNTYTLTLTRETVLTQLLALVNEGNFYAEDIMAALDKLTYITQEQAEELERCVKVVLSATTDPDELMAQLSAYVDSASTSATTATAKAAAASTSADSAAVSASTATSKAEEAADSAATAAAYSRIRVSNTYYPVGTITFSPSLPKPLWLLCTTAGTTNATEPSGISSLTEGGTITDGGAVWTAISLVSLSALTSALSSYTTTANLYKTAVINDTETSGTAGGTFTNGAWRTRVLNTIVKDTIGITLASNQITLPAGTYIIDADAPAFAVYQHKIRLYNITASSTIQDGTSEMSITNYNGHCRSFVSAYFTVSVSTTIELQHECTNTIPTNGLGYPSYFGNAEIYARMIIKKVA